MRKPVSNLSLLLFMAICGWLTMCNSAFGQSAEYFLKQGDLYRKQGSLQRAIYNYNLAIKKNPRFAKAYYQRGKLYHQEINSYHIAIANYVKALKINPKLSNKAYNQLGIACNKAGEYDLTIKFSTQALKLYPRYYKAYFNRAIAWHKKGFTSKALADATRGEKYSPEKNYKNILRKLANGEHITVY